MDMAMPKLFSLKIFQKILITMLLVSLVPLCVIWYIDYKNAIAQTTESINQQLADVSGKLTNTVDAWITMHLKLLNQNGSLADMKTMDPAKQNPILRTVLKGYEWSYLVFTMGPDGMNIGRSDDKPPIDYSDRVYFKQVVEGAPMGQQVVISRTTGKPALILSAPIHNQSENPVTPNATAGVIAIGVSIDELSERITNVRVGRTGFAFLLNEKGQVIAHQRQEFPSKLADFSAHAAFVGKPAEGTKQITYVDGEDPVIALVSRTKYGWTLVMQQNYDEAFAPVREANRNAIVLLGATLVLVTLIAYMFSQGLARPIRRLTQIADEMSRGRTVVKIDEIRRGDEIGALAAAIDRMGMSIRLAIERLKAKAPTPPAANQSGPRVGEAR